MERFWNNCGKNFRNIGRGVEIILCKSRVQFETFKKESRNGWKSLLSLYGNFSQAWKISENIMEENCYGHFVENF